MRAGDSGQQTLLDGLEQLQSILCGQRLRNVLGRCWQCRRRDPSAIHRHRRHG